MTLPVAAVVNEHDNDDIPVAASFLDWQSLRDMMNVNFRVAYSIFSIFFKEAERHEFNGNIKEGFAFFFSPITDTKELRKSAEQDRENANNTRKAGLTIAAVYLGVASVVTFTYWLAVEGVFHSAYKGLVAAGKSIAESIVASASWAKKSCVNLAAGMRASLSNLFTKNNLPEATVVAKGDITVQDEIDWESLPSAAIVAPPALSATVVAPPQADVPSYADVDLPPANFVSDPTATSDCSSSSWLPSFANHSSAQSTMPVQVQPSNTCHIDRLVL